MSYNDSIVVQADELAEIRFRRSLSASISPSFILAIASWASPAAFEWRSSASTAPDGAFSARSLRIRLTWSRLSLF